MQCSAIAPRDTHVSNKVKQFGNRNVCGTNVCLLRTASSLDTGSAAHRGWTSAPHNPMTHLSSNRSQELALGATTGELPQVAPSPTPRTNTLSTEEYHSKSVRATQSRLHGDWFETVVRLHIAETMVTCNSIFNDKLQQQWKPGAGTGCHDWRTTASSPEPHTTDQHPDYCCHNSA
jgi:hypothetical protein